MRPARLLRPSLARCLASRAQFAAVLPARTLRLSGPRRFTRRDEPTQLVPAGVCAPGAFRAPRSPVLFCQRCLLIRVPGLPADTESSRRTRCA
ncbi:hypothetical protein V5799_031488 [Amblyomma americanum]|uniref:Uncharacterized protein n=1 Tax=Amblyomma americanum TaxID=6943 RepID=A0AAQ4EK35_AMBAM